MTLISRRDASKILLAGSAGLVVGCQNVLAAPLDQLLRRLKVKPPSRRHRQVHVLPIATRRSPRLRRE